MSLLQTVRTGAILPTPEAVNDWIYPQGSATREAGREPSREASIEQQKRPRTLQPGAHEKLQGTLTLLKQLEHSGTADTSKLHEIEANLILLKKEVPSDTPEADEIQEFEANKVLLQELARMRTPNSTSIYAIQAALTLLRKRVHTDLSESTVFDEIQTILNRLKQTGLSVEQPPTMPGAAATGALPPTNDPLRDRKDTSAKSTMSNGAAAANDGLDTDRLAYEIHRHGETRQTLANTEATVRKQTEDLAKLESLIEDFRSDREELKERVGDLEEVIRERENEIQQQEARIRELEADAAPLVMRLEAIQGELDTERSMHAAVRVETAQRETALHEAVRQIDDLEKRAQEDAARLKEKDKKCTALLIQLFEAESKIELQDKRLRIAAAEKKKLKGTVAEADGHLQETAGVVGETVLNLNSELERLMAAIQGLNVATEPAERRRRKQKT